MPSKTKVYAIDTDAPLVGADLSTHHGRGALHHLNDSDTLKFDPDEVLNVSLPRIRLCFVWDLVACARLLHALRN